MTDYERLLQKAREIKTEVTDKANTALRVGGWMEMALSYLDGLILSKADAVSADLLTQAKTLAGAINELASLSSLSEERYADILTRVYALEMKIGLKEYANKSEFPEQGKPGALYADKSTGRVYRWVDSGYAVLGGYTPGDGIDITDGVISNTHTFIDRDELMDIGILD